MGKMKPSTIIQIKTANFLFISKPEGKMHDIDAVTTTCNKCEFCKMMSECEGTACSKCYAKDGLKFKPASEMHYERNYELLETAPLEDWKMPRLYGDIARLDTHGDIDTMQGLMNRLKIAVFNPRTEITGWTKRIDLLRKAALTGINMPKNLHIKVSSPYLNKELPQSLKLWFKAHGWQISYFTVYSLDYLIAKYGVDYLRLHIREIINCGGRDCRGCMNCYGKDADYSKDIHELLKQDVKRAHKMGIMV